MADRSADGAGGMGVSLNELRSSTRSRQGFVQIRDPAGLCSDFAASTGYAKVPHQLELASKLKVSRRCFKIAALGTLAAARISA
jgi:hypothetical protein